MAFAIGYSCPRTGAPLTAHVVGVLTGTASPGYALGLADGEQAWDECWRACNLDPVTHRRRGVVGHSQGAVDAVSLLRDRVDAHADVQPSLMSAFLLGGTCRCPPTGRWRARPRGGT
ncbi:DUF3089 domain-containing protein [Amycolatopsis sp. NPDC051903]|uniref:DUF3089 domain-containing protein n=1 Tax=Amycolatopsis sp. NPDC051903 TaxID=3363936 RepID=UPI0037A37D43